MSGVELLSFTRPSSLPRIEGMKRNKPWNKPAPKCSPKTKLTPASIAKAKAAAKKAGRRYPNLIDNMRAAAEQKETEEENRIGYFASLEKFRITARTLSPPHC